MASFPTIPDPTKDPTAIYESVKALKESVELITGQRKGADAPFARLFSGAIAPGKSGSGITVSALKDGDMWLDLSIPPAKLKYWDTRTKFWTALA